MAGRTLFTEFHLQGKRFREVYSLLRRLAHYLKSLPPWLTRQLLPPSQIFGPARGFYSVYELVRQGKTHAENILDSGVPPFFVPGAMRDLVVLLGFDRCLAELRP